MSSNSRAIEYRELVEGILADDAALRAQGLPGLDEEEILEFRDMLARIERRVRANMTNGAAAE